MFFGSGGVPVERRNPTTLDVTTHDGIPVPMQGGAVYPSFEVVRPRVELGGTWKARRIQRPAVEWSGIRDPAWLLEARNEAGLLAGLPVDWDDRILPGCENRMCEPEHDANPEIYEAAVWYAREVSIPDTGPSPDQWRLVFLAVNYVADVWWDDTYLGCHEGGYTPFQFLVPDTRPGTRHVLMVRVENPPWGSNDSMVPAVVGDWFNYAGILHDVYLERLPAVRIDRLDAVPVGEGVRSAAIVSGLSGDFTGVVRFTLHQAEIREGQMLEPDAARLRGREIARVESIVSVSENGIGTASAVIDALDAPRWTADAPVLLVLRAELMAPGGGIVDDVSVQTGIRSVGVDSGAVTINGEPVFLAGIARHEDWMDTGRTGSPERILGDLRIIKGLGCNFLRTGHYPNHPFTYVLMDRIGLLGAEEIPVWQHKPRHFKADAESGVTLQMWREMCLRDRNRPSLILWSTGNECAGENPPKERMKHIARLREDLCSRYDDGRLVTQSAAADEPGAEDASQDLCDVAGWTMYFGIFHGGTYRAGTRAFLDKAKARFGDKPLMATEFGFWSSPATEDRFWLFRNPANKDWRHVHGDWQERQAEVLVETAGAFDDFLRAGGSLAGTVWWTVFDWYRHVPGLQTMGVIRGDRTTRKRAAGELTGAYARLQTAFLEGRKSR